MKRFSVLVFTLIALLLTSTTKGDQLNVKKAVLVIHGGAGTIRKANMTPELEAEYRAKLKEALLAGYQVIHGGGSSLDAVEASIRVMEDSPLFNAGRGAVFTHDGKNEMDAAIMDGKTLKAGGVTEVTIIRNPISAARAVMEKSPHVLLAGRGAELFATKMGLEIVDPSYFWTEKRWKQLQLELEKERETGKQQVPHVDLLNQPTVGEEKKFGTVGAAALDRSGNLAAGTSTGGMTNKQYGRVGDSPIIGAGTYADNGTCAVSGTGYGEYFMRYVVAYDMAARMKYQRESVAQAADDIINKTLPAAGGDGGLIALDHDGNFAMTFNTEGMYRGWIGEDGEAHVFLYKD